MDNVEAIPKDLKPELMKELGSGELLIILLSADIRSDGNYGKSWFALTDERILVFEPKKDQLGKFIIKQISLEDIGRVYVRNYVGCGALLVDLKEETEELIRFSLSAYFKFSSIPQAIEAATDIDEQEVEDIVDEDADVVSIVDHCKKCGLALRKGSTTCPNCLQKTETFWRLFSYIKPYKTRALIGFSLTIAMTVITLLPPQLNLILIDDVILPTTAPYMQTVNEVPQQVLTPNDPQQIPERATDLLIWIVAGLIGTNIIGALAGAARVHVLGWLGQHVVYDIQMQLFKHLQHLSLNFYSVLSTGRIMTRVTSDTERMRLFITSGFQDIVINILTLIGIFLLMLSMNWQLTLLAMIPIPFMILFTIVYRTRIHWIFHRIWRRISTLNNMLADTIPGVKVVKAFAQENREFRRFNEKNTDLRESQMASIHMKAIFLPTISFTISLGSIILWWFGGHQVLSNTLTLGELQAFITYMMMFYAPVRALCTLTEQLESAATTAERVFEILDTQAEIEDSDTAIDRGKLEGSVEFRNVSFTYDGAARVLDRVSFSVKSGEMIGIVGHSGSGKSTMVNLISRFYDASEGHVLIDGKPITTFKQQSLRNQIGVVLQEPLLFQGSIAKNISYGYPEASKEQIIEAARAANAHRFIMNFPDGYDTQVGERGGRLSGGERQRISIARALIGNPRILILDEATASVDTQTEFEIQEALERLVSGRTTFAIAHRLSTLKNADRLIVLDRGRIAEVGTHDALLAQDEGVYKKLVSMQTEMAKVRAI